MFLEAIQLKVFRRCTRTLDLCVARSPGRPPLCRGYQPEGGPGFYIWCARRIIKMREASKLHLQHCYSINCEELRARVLGADLSSNREVYLSFPPIHFLRPFEKRCNHPVKALDLHLSPLQSLRLNACVSPEALKRDIFIFASWLANAPGRQGRRTLRSWTVAGKGAS